MLSFIDRASKQKAQLILFPENVLYIGNPAHLYSTSIALRSIPSRLQTAAKEGRIAILVGSYPMPSRRIGKVFNASLFIDERGRILGKYKKIHLFDVVTPDGEVYAESKFISPGKSPVIIRWKGMKIGLSICYDLRFPEHYRALRKKGAEVLLIPSAFTFETGKAHWHTLLRSRAIENLAYVLAPAQTGKHDNGRRTFGHSLAIDPWGRIISDAGNRIGLSYLTIDVATPRKYRSQFGTE